jgi:phosphoribosylaminoimidazole-succinocarboxamide synthase
MPYIPSSVAESSVSDELGHCGLKRIHQGKVRDTYELPDHPDHLLVVVTDRISIFDFVLGSVVPNKGEVLNALSVFFLTNILSAHEHHLAAYGSGIDQWIPNPVHRFPDLQARAQIVKRRKMVPVECVVRGVLTGSAWEKYQAGARKLWGYDLPDGLHDGVWLDAPMFTPTDKAESGHDEPVTRDFVKKHYGPGMEEFSILLFKQIRDYSRKRGIIFADTKFEMDHTLMLCDEVATPDSSRFWDVADYQKAQAEGKAPDGYDKQPVREWGKSASEVDGNIVSIKKLDPKSEADCIRVGNIPVPNAVLHATTERYLAITARLTGMELPQYQERVLKVA